MTMTYILQIDGPDALVKIGRSKNIKSRLASLKTGLPWPVRVVALIGADVERDLLTMFADERVNGEWVRPTKVLADWLDAACDAGRLVKQVPVDQAYINAVIKPRIREYLNGREPTNSPAGDLVRVILNDLLPTLSGREGDLYAATKGQVTDALCRGYGPTNERPHLVVPSAAVEAARAA